MFGDRTFDRQERIEIAEKIRSGERKFYVDYKYIEVSCCSGPHGRRGGEYEICLLTVDHEEPYIFIDYPEYLPNEVTPKIRRVGPSGIE